MDDMFDTTKVNSNHRLRYMRYRIPACRRLYVMEAADAHWVGTRLRILFSSKAGTAIIKL